MATTGSPKISPHPAKPRLDAAVGGDDHRALLVALADQLEGQAAAVGDNREGADLVDDQERSAAEEADLVAQPALARRLGERGDDIGEGNEVDAAPGRDRLDPECDRKVAFAGAGRSEQMDHLVAAAEVERGERQDAVAVERGPENDVPVWGCADPTPLQGMRDAPFEPEDGAKWQRRQRLEMRLLRGEGRVDDPPGGGVDPRVGERVQPFAELPVQIIEVAKRAGEEDNLADVAVRPLDLALGFS